jgi:hypothetical protein
MRPIRAAQAKHFCKIVSVAHQAAGSRKFAELIDCRDRVSERQSRNLLTSGIEEDIGADDQPSGLQLC